VIEASAVAVDLFAFFFCRSCRHVRHCFTKRLRLHSFGSCYTVPSDNQHDIGKLRSSFPTCSSSVWPHFPFPPDNYPFYCILVGLIKLDSCARVPTLSSIFCPYAFLSHPPSRLFAHIHGLVVGRFPSSRRLFCVCFFFFYYFGWCLLLPSVCFVLDGPFSGHGSLGAV